VDIGLGSQELLLLFACCGLPAALGMVGLTIVLLVRRGRAPKPPPDDVVLLPDDDS
jgi:hypothetical protein